MKENQAMAGRLDGAEIEIKAKTSQAGTLYSAVSAQKIAQEIKKNFVNESPGPSGPAERGHEENKRQDKKHYRYYSVFCFCF